MTMKLANPPKAVILMLGIVCITVLMAMGRITSDAGLPVLTALSGYGIGNGVGARRQQNSPHIFEPANGPADQT